MSDVSRLNYFGLRIVKEVDTLHMLPPVHIVDLFLLVDNPCWVMVINDRESLVEYPNVDVMSVVMTQDSTYEWREMDVFFH